MTTTVELTGYARNMALGSAPITADCPHCGETRGSRCRSKRDTSWIHVGFHKARMNAVAHLSDTEKLSAVAVLRAEVEKRRQAAIAQLDAIKTANQWDARNQQERR